MGQPHTKQKLFKSSSNANVTFRFTEDAITFDKLKKIRSDTEAKNAIRYFTILQIAEILQVDDTRRILRFCKKQNITTFLKYYEQLKRQVQVVTIEDAEYIIRNFNLVKKSLAFRQE
jgi:hypothetical protein